MRTGLVWKRLEDNIQNRNINQPFGAFNLPVSGDDPGPDGIVGNADDGSRISAFNLAAANLGSADHYAGQLQP